MASPSDSLNLPSEEAEVTSDNRHHPQQLTADETAAELAAMEFELEFPLVRQSSIYSLTLDEIQNALCEPGKTFGSMNMDEFLTNIWNADDGQVAPPPANGGSAAVQPCRELCRQGSLALPAPLCRKTVDEVWTEIHCGGAAQRSQQQVPQQYEDGGVVLGGMNSAAHRQPTLGEMTLEDFLIKAGVVREGYTGNGPPAAPVTPPQYAIAGFQIPATEIPAQFGHHMMSYAELQQAMQNGVGYAVGKGYMANEYGGINGSPASPGGSSEGMGGGGGHGDGGSGAMAAYGAPEGGGEGQGMNSRKRGPPDNGMSAEVVVERRQRRMIKNRESAARSRARKQAYTVELEAELNQLKEENAQLKEEQRRSTLMQKKLLLDAMSEKARANVHAKVRKLRRCSSASW